MAGIRLDHRLRIERPVDPPDGPTPRWSAWKPASRGPRAMPAARLYTNDLFSHADVYTALEAAVADRSPRCFAREQRDADAGSTCRWPQTMLYVNEHLHDQLYDGACRRRPHPQLRSRRLSRRSPAADGDLVTISGHPAERGTFELFVAGLRSRRPGRRRSASPTVAGRLQPTSTELAGRRIAGGGRGRSADATALEERLGADAPRPPARCAAARELARVAVGRSQRRAIASVPGSPRRGRSASPTHRGASTTPPWRSPPSRATAARTTAPCSPSLLGYDDATIDELEASGVLSSKPPTPSVTNGGGAGARRRPLPARPRGKLRFPLEPPAGDAGAWRARVRHAGAGSAAAGNAATAGAAGDVGGLEHMVDHVDDSVGRDDSRAGDRCRAVVDHQNIAVRGLRQRSVQRRDGAGGNQLVGPEGTPTTTW